VSEWASGSVREALYRVRVFAGQLALLAALALVAAVLVTGAPKAANHLADQALRNDVAAVPFAGRDIIVRQSPFFANQVNVAGAEGALEGIARDFAPPLPGLIGGAWFSATVGPEEVRTRAPRGPRTQFGLRMQSGATEATRLTAGRWPANREPVSWVEVAVSTDVADQMGLRLGTLLRLESDPPVPLAVVVVGIFEPIDRSAPLWDDAREALVPAPGLGDEIPPVAVALTDPAGLSAAASWRGEVIYTWRYRVDEHRLHTGMLDEVIGALAQVERGEYGPAASAGTSLDTVLSRFDDQMRAVRALLGVVQAGLLATLLGLVVLAARLAVDRRRAEFVLLRARGGAVRTIGGRALAESIVVLPAAVVAGWLLGRLVPGRPADTGWLLVLVGALTVLAVPVLAMAGQRRLSFTARRRDLVGARPSARRLVAELSVLGLAVLGVFLLRRRGLSQDTGVDPYLVCVPVLLATGTALIALRIVPWPLRQAGRFAARARGAVAFLGLARAGRGAPAIVGPLAVVVVAVTTGVFCSVVTSTIAAARDRASALEIPADAQLTGFRFTPETVDRLAAAPGVAAVAPMIDFPGTPIRGSGGTEFARFVVVDPDTFRRVVNRSGVEAPIPPALADATRGSGPVPAVVSPEVAATFGRGGAAATRVGYFEFAIAAVSDTFPGLGVDPGRFIVLPWQAVPQPASPLAPNRILIAGSGFTMDGLRDIGDEGQRAYVEGGITTLAQPTEVTTRAGHRERLDSTGANDVLSFAFLVGTAGAAALALLAIGFAVLAEARSRGTALSRLRTMGLSSRQSRNLLVYELVPLVCVAVLSGALVGTLLPRLLGPTLGLDTFTAGAPARTQLDPLLLAGLLVLVLVALAVALTVENVVNRRMRLGEVLRLGEES